MNFFPDNKKEWHLSDKCNDKLPFICKANVGGIKPPDWSNGDPRGDLLDCEVLGEGILLLLTLFI